MPYITEKRRDALENPGEHALNSGELNYILSMVVKDYLQIHGLSYQTCNDIVGAFDNAKDEFRRRIQHPYEDEKIEQNGDVY